jgi:hypothetical protein
LVFSRHYQQMLHVHSSVHLLSMLYNVGNWQCH